MNLRFLRLRRRVVEPVAEPVPVKPRKISRYLVPLRAGRQAATGAFASLDRAFSCLAIPFGVRIRNPRLRFAVLLGVFAFIYLLGALPFHLLPLVALVFGYVGVLAIGRAWVRNEKERTAISKKLQDGDPDEMPDLRWTALISALQLLVLFPLLFQQLEWHFHLFARTQGATFFDWLWFSLDKTYLKALPDWSILYGVRINEIEFDGRWGRHLVFLSRLTFDYILIQGVLRLLAIRSTIREAVAAVKADPEMAVRLGQRAVGPLIEKLNDPDRAVRGAAANALTQLDRLEAIHAASESARSESEAAAGRV